MNILLPFRWTTWEKGRGWTIWLVWLTASVKASSFKLSRSKSSQSCRWSWVWVKLSSCIGIVEYVRWIKWQSKVSDCHRAISFIHWTLHCNLIKVMCVHHHHHHHHCSQNGGFYSCLKWCSYNEGYLVIVHSGCISQKLNLQQCYCISLLYAVDRILFYCRWDKNSKEIFQDCETVSKVIPIGRNGKYFWPWPEWPLPWQHVVSSCHGI